MARRKPIPWKDALGLIPLAVLVAILAFENTRSLWFRGISAGDKALFWASTASALATIGLFAVAVIAAVVAYRQFLSARENTQIEATTDLIREWSGPDLRSLLANIDFKKDPQANRRHLRLLYRFSFSDNTSPNDPRRLRAWRSARIAARDAMNTKIETVVLMASRTWNLLNAKIISERVLFDQLDYDILATYFILEDVLATRQCNDKIIYSSFTKLARRAQSHYKRRPNKEISIPLVQVDFEDLPYDGASLENYVARALSREAAWRLSESI